MIKTTGMFFCRLKHDASVELLRSKELLNIQSGAIAELEQKLAAAAARQRPINDALVRALRA